MKFGTKLLAGFLVLALTAVLFAACGGKSVVGTWEMEGMRYEFKEDGTYVMTMTNLNQEKTGTYKTEDGKLIFDNLAGIDYTIDGDTLSFTMLGYGLLSFQKVA